MIISPSKEFIFIHLEKCGGTSVETALEPYLAWHDMIIGSTNFGESIQSLYFNRFGVDKVKSEMLWKHSSAQEIYQFVGPDNWNDFKKFSVVRDPQELIKSLYNFSATVAKYHLGRINREAWKERLRVKDYPQAFPFTEGYLIEYAKSEIDGTGINGFVENILSEDYSFCSPQTNRLSVDGSKDLGAIIDLSRLTLEWDSLTEYLGFDFHIPISHLNKSENHDIELSPRAIKKIKKHFAIDYDVLPEYTGVYWK